MRFVEQAIECFAAPPKVEFELGPQRARERMQARVRNRAEPTALDPAYEGVRHAGARGEVDLAEALPAAQGADRAAESDHVHARTVRQRPYRPLHV